MKDIKSREDVMIIMQHFYSKLMNDESLGYIFKDVAKLDLEEHLPALTDFWENLLLTPNNYRKNVMQIHLDLNKKVKLNPEHFTLWINYLKETIGEHFYGKKADEMIEKANHIAQVMQIKLSHV